MVLTKKMKNSMEGAEETKPKISEKKDRRSRKPKFELCKPRKVTKLKKKKDKKKKRIAEQQLELGFEEICGKLTEIRAENQQLKLTTVTDELRLEEFRLMCDEVRVRNQEVKDLISYIEDYILASLDDEDK